MGNVQGLEQDQSPGLLPNLKTNTPNTLPLSTEVKAEAQSPANHESSQTHEDLTSLTDHDMSSALFFVEPDPETIHPNVDLSDRNNLVRLLALYQCGWRQGRGRGPREHETCIWCRGPVAPNVEVLTHVGNSNSCRNSWPATCLLEWIDQELGAAKNHALQCPMCREQFFSCYSTSDPDFRKDQGGPDAQGVISAAWVRCILFSPLYARETCVKKGKPLIIIKSEEARKLVLLNKEQYIFNGCENLSQKVFVRMRRLLHRAKGTNILQSSESPSASETLVLNTVASSTRDRPVEEEKQLPKPPLDTMWALLDWGDNQFRMSPLLAHQAHALKTLTEQQGGVVKTMNADEFAALAKGNGGLERAVRGFQPDDEAELAAMKVSGTEWLIKMQRESSKEDERASEKEWYERLAEFYQVSVDPETGEIEHPDAMREPPSSLSTDTDDEWDGSDESLPELPIV
ncbi:hypothetical protein AYL99_05295 [Fonsecaea erecta]|uniref:Uncharacterized protein n=1 Tax=Fonsecaea erecta TaxID=1367422 RepID=A0A178ZM59_9EURO|nr:hypothetical protein AYL99_05295 [Fonsecaea erecta]OAP60293.1 hypothetical protein AYL99_05295 [Fonsecaea erecta]